MNDLYFEKLKRRFLSGCTLSGQCWLWTKTRLPSGYGKIGVKRDGKHKVELAHRVSLFLATNQWPAGVVMHTCDNPSCVNPEHLRVGTQKENLVDMSNKGRSLRGEKSASARLTPTEVEEIRKSTKLNSELASLFGVSWTTIARIKRHETWR